jgi:hypothetical protein
MKQIFVILVAILAASSVALCQNSGKSKSKEANAKHQALMQTARNTLEAFTLHDSSVLNLILADEFLAMADNGKIVSKTQVTSHCDKHKPVKGTVTRVLKESDVRAYGNVSVMTGIITTKNKDDVTEIQERFTAVWVNKQNKWLLTKLHMSRIGQLSSKNKQLSQLKLNACNPGARLNFGIERQAEVAKRGTGFHAAQFNSMAIRASYKPLNKLTKDTQSAFISARLKFKISTAEICSIECGFFDVDKCAADCPGAKCECKSCGLICEETACSCNCPRVSCTCDNNSDCDPSDPPEVGCGTCTCRCF